MSLPPRRRVPTLALALVSLVLGGWAPAAEPSFHALASLEAGPSGPHANLRVDSAGRRVFIASGSRVEVLNADSGAPLGEIPTDGEALDIAVAADLRQGFATAAGDALVSFDLATLRPIRTVRIPGLGGDAAVYDEDTRQLFIASASAGTISVVDPESLSLKATLSVKGGVRSLACNGFNKVYAAGDGGEVMQLIDSHRPRVLGQFRPASGKGIRCFALAPSTRRLIVACADQRVAILDADTGFPEAVASLGSNPIGATCDAMSRQIFVACDDGTVALLGRIMISADNWTRYQVIERVPAGARIRAIAIDEKTRRAMVLTGESPSNLKVISIGR